jgi:hypothetical protein
VRFVAWLLALTALPWAAAWTLRVDPSDGPLVLVDHVDAALADWRAAGADVEGTDRDVVVRYGDPARLGPDALVLVVVRPDSGAFEVLVHPELEGVRAALVPALGVVLGGVPGSGALDPRVDPAQTPVPGADDVATLRAARSALVGDVDGDGRVDFEDLLRVAAAYGRQGVNLPEDLDGDGIVGDGDLEALRERYTFGPADGDPDAPTPAGPGDEEAPSGDDEAAPAEDGATPGDDETPGSDEGPGDEDAPGDGPDEDDDPEAPAAPD